MQSDNPEDQKSTEGMVDYNRNSAAQQQIIDSQAMQIRGLVEKVSNIGTEFRIVDYGCGPGISTINVMRPAIEACRSAHPGEKIAACHADQPGNDWNTLFGLVSGPSGYLNGTENVRTEAAIGSFYKQMAAENSVSLGTCFAASHWFSRALHLYAPNTVWFADLEGEARAEMAAFARQDWLTFLRCRALELHPGGYLLVSTLGSVPDAQEKNGFAASGRGIYRALQVVAREMADEGLINGEILDNFVFSLWFMSEDEARDPLKQDPELSKAFEIDTLKVEPAPLHQADLFADSIGDPVEYARLYTGYVRAFADSTLRKQLFEPSTNSAEDADRLADEFFHRLDGLYRKFLDKYAFEIWHLTVVLRRR
ncbi:MAG: class I SAM-dependent methyltransferase [Hyphomicrobiales bacterium]|nr:class I SAM-dependent methyltransferase [Hyphomicrobiales bacterium]MCP4999417.1 class I SAM-dependent methyltransferase [Hyphomicrobiales bacterium]